MDRKTSAALCKGGCGFYGSPRHNDLCSQCHRLVVELECTDACDISSVTDSEDKEVSQNSDQQPDALSLPTDISMVIEKYLNSQLGDDMLRILPGNWDDAASSCSRSTTGATVGSVSSSRIYQVSQAAMRMSTSQMNATAESSGSLPSTGLSRSNSSNSLLSIAEQPQSPSRQTVSSWHPSEESSECTSDLDLNDIDLQNHLQQPQNQQSQQQQPRRKRRCNACRRNLGLLGFSCHCGGLFCSIHRYSDQHRCNFNFRENGRDTIRRNNPTVTSKKIYRL